ncbi:MULTISPECIES: hypothetical protein [Cyanophyceae]|nr:hypothetical protein [Trichocoleus sp. FACHB-832]
MRYFFTLPDAIECLEECDRVNLCNFSVIFLIFVSFITNIS